MVRRIEGLIGIQSRYWASTVRECFTNCVTRLPERSEKGGEVRINVINFFANILDIAYYKMFGKNVLL